MIYINLYVRVHKVFVFIYVGLSLNSLLGAAASLRSLLYPLLLLILVISCLIPEKGV